MLENRVLRDPSYRRRVMPARVLSALLPDNLMLCFAVPCSRLARASPRLSSLIAAIPNRDVEFVHLHAPVRKRSQGTADQRQHKCSTGTSSDDHRG